MKLLEKTPRTHPNSWKALFGVYADVSINNVTSNFRGHTTRVDVVTFCNSSVFVFGTNTPQM